MPEGFPEIGWYADPAGRYWARWWDGRAWTDRGRAHPAPAGGRGDRGDRHRKWSRWLAVSVTALVLLVIMVAVSRGHPRTRGAVGPAPSLAPAASSGLGPPR